MPSTSVWIRDVTDGDPSSGPLGMVKPGTEEELVDLDEELPPSPRATGAAAVLAVVLAMVGAAALTIASPAMNESLTDGHLPAPSPVVTGDAAHHGQAPTP